MTPLAYAINYIGSVLGGFLIIKYLLHSEPDWGLFLGAAMATVLLMMWFGVK